MTYLYPNLFIPGAAKSGTTSLHELLDAHPDVCMSTVKEPVFWNSDFETPKRIKWYNSLFVNKNAKVLGESTTSYMYFPEFIKNVKENFEKTPKFIFILRNPIDRCFSHYWWMVGRGQENKSFKDSVNYDINREYQNHGYVPDFYYHFGLYGKWLKKFYNNFESHNIKIITLEQLVSDRLDTLNDCFDFLDLPPLEKISNIKANQTQKFKYPKIHHFITKSLMGKYKYTRFVKYLLTTKQIDLIKKRLRGDLFFSKSKRFTYRTIKSEERLWLKSIYNQDINSLKQLTGLEFSEWEDFNN